MALMTLNIIVLRKGLVSFKTECICFLDSVSLISLAIKFLTHGFLVLIPRDFIELLTFGYLSIF